MKDIGYVCAGSWYLKSRVFWGKIARQINKDPANHCRTEGQFCVWYDAKQ